MSFARRPVVAFVLALAMVLVLSGSVSAASATVTTVGDTCTLSGGAWGYGKGALKVTASEHALYAVDRIVFTASLMHQARAGGDAWSVHQTQQRTRVFTATATGTRSRTWTAVWYFGGDTAVYRHRIEMKIDFMSGNDAIVATRGVIGSSC
ncbi:MAG: hypothetical protein QOJ81_2178 [Chloroflexota bacterium]|jgi:hypothetical protein|nr:hypothetical protein [Chloroflexota bacterium]